MFHEIKAKISQSLIHSLNIKIKVFVKFFGELWKFCDAFFL